MNELKRKVALLEKELESRDEQITKVGLSFLFRGLACRSFVARETNCCFSFCF